jgi:PPOX class probable F420-dependent enzyme
MANPLVMERTAAEEFLAGSHVGMLAVERPTGPPLLGPVWYAYEPGADVRFVIGRDSEKARLLAAAGRASFSAQSEDLPYAFVTVDGPVVVDDGVDEELRVSLAVRYLGEELGAAYAESTKDHDSVLARLTPERWRSNDYSKVTL